MVMLLLLLLPPVSVEERKEAVTVHTPAWLRGSTASRSWDREGCRTQEGDTVTELLPSVASTEKEPACRGCPAGLPYASTHSR